MSNIVLGIAVVVINIALTLLTRDGQPNWITVIGVSSGVALILFGLAELKEKPK